MFYELDSEGAPSAPVLYIDTAKVTTISQSAETVDARGGKSNVKLLSWDTNKELTMELTDALFSAKSLGIMFGGTMQDNGDTQEVLKTLRPSDLKEYSTTPGGSKTYFGFTINGTTYAILKTQATYFKYQAGQTDPSPVAPTSSLTTGDFDFMTFDLLDCTAVNASGLAVERNNTAGSENGIVKDGITINIGAEFNANTYYITGDTYARNYQSGKDEFLQFIIPKGKVSAEDVSLTMEADGDPAEFTMSIQCLKANNGSMLQLIKYNLSGDGAAVTTLNKGVASVLDEYNDYGYGENAGYAPNASIADASLNDATAAGSLDD
jgi:hypothetical protein